MPGRILSELVHNDRCIGGVTPTGARRAQRFYKTFVRGACIATSSRAAEMVKLTENAFRDTNIAFVNELSLICDRYGVNVWEVIDRQSNPRVMSYVRARASAVIASQSIRGSLSSSAPDLARLIKTSREVNDFSRLLGPSTGNRLIEEHPYANVACCGLAFKANVDDLRESPRT